MREVVVNNKDLRDLMVKRHEAFTKSEGIGKQIEDLEQERVKVAYKIDKFKQKMIPYAKEEEEKLKLDEYEYIETLEMTDDGVKFVIKDQIEEFKARIAEKKNAEQTS
jgi:endo-1,4-beta-D-glucanase Y